MYRYKPKSLDICLKFIQVVLLVFSMLETVSDKNPDAMNETEISFQCLMLSVVAVTTKFTSDAFLLSKINSHVLQGLRKLVL